jgi:hypothetical protein
MAKTKLLKTSFYIDEERLRRLKEVSDRTMIPMARLIRKAVDRILEEYSTKKSS